MQGPTPSVNNAKKKAYMKLYLYFSAMVLLLAMVATTKGVDFEGLLQVADRIEDAEFDLIETVSMGGTTVTDLHARVLASESLDLSRYTMLDDDGNELFAVLADRANEKCYYSVAGVVAEAPSDEAQNLIQETQSFYSLRQRFESGCDVYDSGTAEDEGHSARVFNIYRFGGITSRWHRIFVDPASGMVLREEMYDGEVLRARNIRVVGINQEAGDIAFRSGFASASYPTVSLQLLLAGDKTTQPANVSELPKSGAESKESRLARVNGTIERLPAIIEINGNSTRFRNFLAAAYCSRAFLINSSADADQSISMYRILLAQTDLSEFDRVESLLGLARACLCKVYLEPSEREKLELEADSILQKLTNDTKLDPVLRNIAGAFSMQWQSLKDQGQPQQVVDWLGWMEQLRQWETDHAEK